MDIIMDTLDLDDFLYCRDAMHSRNISNMKGFISYRTFNLSTLKDYRQDVEVFDFPHRTFIIKEKYLGKYILKGAPRTIHVVYL